MEISVVRPDHHSCQDKLPVLTLICSSRSCMVCRSTHISNSQVGTLARNSNHRTLPCKVAQKHPSEALVRVRAPAQLPQSAHPAAIARPPLWHRSKSNHSSSNNCSSLNRVTQGSGLRRWQASTRSKRHASSRTSTTGRNSRCCLETRALQSLALAHSI